MEINKQIYQKLSSHQPDLSSLRILEFQYFLPAFSSPHLFIFYSLPSLFILSFSYYQLTVTPTKSHKHTYDKVKKGMVRTLRSITQKAVWRVADEELEPDRKKNVRWIQYAKKKWKAMPIKVIIVPLRYENHIDNSVVKIEWTKEE